MLKNRSRMGGFTLIELMIVVVIISILASIALPAYNNQMIKSRRTDAQRVMAEFSQAEERYYTTNGSYASAGTTCGAALPAATAYYTYSCAVVVATGVFTITATANTGAQLADGNLTLNSTGAKTPADKWKY